MASISPPSLYRGGGRVTERYGTRDAHSMYPAIDALTFGLRQKQTAKRLARDGIED